MNTSSKNNQTVKFLRTPLVLELSGLSKSTIRRRVKEGVFVPPCNLGCRAIAYIESEVQEVLGAMAAGKDQEEIKSLVKFLVEQRQQSL